MTRVKHETGLMVSSVYRFRLDDENVLVNNTLDDENIITTFITRNPICQYGADGIEFDNDGNLYVGNFGDGEINKITFDSHDNVISNTIWAKDDKNLKTTDGMISDRKGAFYIADFGANAIAKIDWADAKVTRIAQSPDCDGFDGRLDQPGEPVIWQEKIVVSCFDTVTNDPFFINSAHEMPCTMSELSLE
jgi:sugar lactone lactonase YvrE